MSRAGILVGLVLALGVSGCVGDDIEGWPAMSPAKIDDVRKTTKHRGHWFGPSFNGMKVRGATSDGSGVGFEYGELNCNDSGCDPDLTVSTQKLNYGDALNDDVCWRRLGAAWVSGCDEDDEHKYLTIYSGDVHIDIRSPGNITDNKLLTSLVPINDRTPTKWKRPERLHCPAAQRFSAARQRSIPAELRPVDCPGLAGV